jgi:orotidine-5'-phosphate decarboxylase
MRIVENGFRRRALDSIPIGAYDLFILNLILNSFLIGAWWMTFTQQLRAAAQRQQSWLCVGLDPDLSRIPAHLGRDSAAVYTFCSAIMEATADLVCAFKPNIAFFEALGAAGMETLRRLMKSPRNVPIILDAKRGDISSTAEAYAQALFDDLQADAVTLSPYLGGDSLEPFLRRADRGCFVLCKTSNPGSADLQDLEVGDAPLYLHVARMAAERWNGNRNLGLVVGATHPSALARVRAACPDLPLLVPGVGAQSGELAASARAAADRHGELAIMNASRSILYASAGHDFVTAARSEALRLRDAINAALL